MLGVGRPRTRKLTIASTLLLAGCVFATVAPTLSSNDNEDAFYTNMCPLVGYFSNYEPSGDFSKIYREYFGNVIRKSDQTMEHLSTDDWRKVRPTGELCVDYLSGIRVKSYVMSKPYEIIILDACLDWLFDESKALKVEQRVKDQARFDRERKYSLEQLVSDSKLRAIYQNTKMKVESALPESLRKEIYDYLINLLHIYSDNPRNGCHSLWLEAYNEFVDNVYIRDCQDETNCRFFGIDDSQKDSYLNMIVESTKQAARTCYNVMQKQMRVLVETEFDRSNTGTNSLKKRFMNKINHADKQSESEKWAREMISILQLASAVNMDTPVNLGVVAEDLYKIKNGDQELIERFTRGLSNYAKNNVDLKDTSGDGLGRVRFGRAMIKLCRPYTNEKKFLSMTGGINTDNSEEGPKPFEFYGLIYSLVRLTNHEQLFELSKDDFEEEVIKNRWEALYLATFACQIISTSWGELTFDDNSGSFDVRLRPEWPMMVAEWPIEVLSEKLPILYPKSGSSKAAAKVANQGGKSAFFGKKFKLNLKKSSSDKYEKEEADHADAQPALAPEPLKPEPVTTTTAPAPISEPPAHRSEAASNSLNSHLPERVEPKVMSWEDIVMFRDLHGRYPKLGPHYHKIYPQLPADLSGVYPKKLLTTKKPRAMPGFSTTGGFGGQYGSTGASGIFSGTGSANVNPLAPASSFGSFGTFGGAGAFGGIGGPGGNGLSGGVNSGGMGGFGGGAAFRDTSESVGNSLAGGARSGGLGGFGSGGGFGGRSAFPGSGGFGGSGGGGGFGGMSGFGGGPPRSSQGPSAFNFN